MLSHKPGNHPWRISSARMTTASPIVFYDLLPEPGVCPYAQRAWIALVELGVPFTTKFVDKANKSEEFLSLYRGIVQDPAGRGTVPTIVDGEYKLTESAVVVEYLDKKYGKPGKTLLPDDPEEFGKVKLFVDTFTSQLVSANFKILRADSRESLAEATAAMDAGAKVLNDFIKVNGSSEGGDFFLGSRYSFAETMTTPFLRRMMAAIPALKEYNLLESSKAKGLHRFVAWIEASLSRPSNQKTGCSDQQIVEGFKTFNTPLKD